MTSQNHTRIAAFDILRGFFLCVIIIDHLYLFPNAFQIITGLGQLWVSAAEGFFIISGILVGYLYYTRPLVRVLQRAIKLGVLAVLISLIFQIWNAHSLADYLSYYAIFLAITPVVFFVLKKFGPWTTIALSLAVWCLRGNNVYLAWQALFVSGTVAGTMWEKLIPKIENYKRVLAWITLITLTISSAVLSTNIEFGKQVFDKPTLGLGRMVLAWIWFITLYIWVRKHEGGINKLTRGSLEKLGRNSLFVYILHAFVVLTLSRTLPGHMNFLNNTLATAAALGVTYFFAEMAGLLRRLRFSQ